MTGSVITEATREQTVTILNDLASDPSIDRRLPQDTFAAAGRRYGLPPAVVRELAEENGWPDRAALGRAADELQAEVERRTRRPGTVRTPRSAVASATDGLKVGLIPVDRVTFHQHNVRQDLGDLRPLAHSITEYGVMQPVVVERYGDRFRLRAGHRRIAACKLAGVTKVPAVIHAAALDDRDWLLHSIQENVMRRDLNDAERARTIRALRELGCTNVGVAEAFGVTPQTISGWANPSPQPEPAPRPQHPRSVPVPARRAHPSKRPGTRRLTPAVAAAFVDQWRAELTYRPVDVDEVLAALSVLVGVNDRPNAA